MKRSIIVLIFLYASVALGQDYSNKVNSLDTIIETLYGVISGEKNEERNWELFRYLFKPEAKLIPSGMNKNGVFEVRYMTPENYIDSAGKWLMENGFYEKEIYRKTETFGNITHIFSTYESFKSTTDTKPFMRGINSIQLLNDGNRWWIVNIYWTQESEDNPIPARYLPN
jgi:hypothetical protein